MDLFSADRLPIVSEPTLKAHKVADPEDTRFRSCARLLQSLWRERQGLPMGSYTTQAGRRRKLGSRLAEPAASGGANFISPEIRRLAFRELAYREPGAQIDEGRLFGNLLSSMPLAFNLFGPMKLNKAVAQAFAEALLPDLTGDVSTLWFEHSPGRGDPTFTNDGTAFDAFIAMRRQDGSKTFLAFEIKYAENMSEAEPRMRSRYDDLAHSSGLFRDPDAPELRKNPLQQIWREHMLAQTLLESGLFDAGAFVLIGPRLNNDVQRAAQAYRGHLADAPHQARFLNLPLEDAIATLGTAGAAAEAQRLHERYCDFAPVHALI